MQVILKVPIQLRKVHIFTYSADNGLMNISALLLGLKGQWPLLVSSADNFCKQFGPRSGLTERQA